MNRRKRLLAVCFVLAALAPGCQAAAILAGGTAPLASPAIAWAGEPYGQSRFDLAAVAGGARWGGAHWGFGWPPWLAAVDLPLAVALDTALLPLSLVRLALAPG